MLTRTAVAAVFIVFVVAGCTPPEASVSASPSAAPTVSTTTTTSASAPANPSPSTLSTPTATSDPGPLAIAGPLTVAGEVSFGITDFGGLPYDQAASVYPANVSPSVHMSACGDAVSPMLFPDIPSTPPWSVMLLTNWNQPGLAQGTETVKAFLLVVQSDNLPTTPMGPVGPRGIRLGTPTATIEAMFPAEAAVTTSRTATVFDFGGDPEKDITERIFNIADVDGGPMIITTVDGDVRP